MSIQRAESSWVQVLKHWMNLSHRFPGRILAWGGPRGWEMSVLSYTFESLMLSNKQNHLAEYLYCIYLGFQFLNLSKIQFLIAIYYVCDAFTARIARSNLEENRVWAGSPRPHLRRRKWSLWSAQGRLFHRSVDRPKYYVLWQKEKKNGFWVKHSGNSDKAKLNSFVCIGLFVLLLWTCDFPRRE
jgi:hypothetical protein